MKCNNAVRTFAAIEINEDLRRKFTALQNELKHTRASVKWVEPANIHFTLAFLGDTLSSILDEVGHAMDAIAQTVAPFSFEVSGLGFFGRRCSPRVIYRPVSLLP